MINPDGVRHQIHGNVIQVLSRTLKERVRFADGKVASREWASYPILTFAEVPDVDVVLMPRQGEPPLARENRRRCRPGRRRERVVRCDRRAVLRAAVYAGDSSGGVTRRGRLMTADAAGAQAATSTA